MVYVYVSSILSAVQFSLLNSLMRVLLRYYNVYSKCVNSWSPHHPYLTSLTAPLSQWIANPILYLLGPRALESSSLSLIINFQLVKKWIIFGLPPDYTWNPTACHHSGCYDLHWTTSCLAWMTVVASHPLYTCFCGLFSLKQAGWSIVLKHSIKTNFIFLLRTVQWLRFHSE